MATYNYIRNSLKDIYKPNILYTPKSGNVVVLEDTTLDVVLEEVGMKIDIIVTLTDEGTITINHNNNIIVEKLANPDRFSTITYDYTLYCKPNDTLTFDTFYETAPGEFTVSDSLGLNTGYTMSSGQSYTYTVTQPTTIEISVSGGCCVPYYSQILYPNNITKSAEDVKVGDIIMGYNELTNTYQETEVLNITSLKRNNIHRITFVDNTTIDITTDHPLLTETGWKAIKPNLYGAYKDVKDLQQLLVSDKILQYNGEFKQISDISLLTNDIMDVYTFNTTEGIDTYIAENCVVHNALCI